MNKYTFQPIREHSLIGVFIFYAFHVTCAIVLVDLMVSKITDAFGSVRVMTLMLLILLSGYFVISSEVSLCIARVIVCPQISHCMSDINVTFAKQALNFLSSCAVYLPGESETEETGQQVQHSGVPHRQDGHKGRVQGGAQAQVCAGQRCS